MLLHITGLSYLSHPESMYFSRLPCEVSILEAGGVRMVAPQEPGT